MDRLKEELLFACDKYCFNDAHRWEYTRIINECETPEELFTHNRYRALFARICDLPVRLLMK